MPGLTDLIGASYGPFLVTATVPRAAAFVAAIGDDAAAWAQRLHPMFASVALFAAAPAFLDHEPVVPFTRSLIHSEQTFQWHRPLDVGSTIEVAGTVESVRARGALHFVKFALAATAAGEPWLEGSSTFLMSEESAADAEAAAEPVADVRPEVDGPASQLPLPEPGGALATLSCAASRTDLMRYAAASGDWNPIHYDHDAARAAGLEGVIVHGLLMAAWMGRAAGRYGSLRSMKLRFRNPLRPAELATVSGAVRHIEGESAALDLALDSGSATLVTGQASVTP